MVRREVPEVAAVTARQAAPGLPAKAIMAAAMSVRLQALVAAEQVRWEPQVREPL